MRSDAAYNQELVLSTIQRGTGMSIQEIADAVRIGYSGVRSAVNSLEWNGYIQRRRDVDLPRVEWVERKG